MTFLLRLLIPLGSTVILGWKKPSLTRRFNTIVPRFHFNQIYYGWWLVPVAGAIMAITVTPMFHAMGLWFVALERNFGWSRTQLSLAFALTRIEGGILGPIEGYFVDKIGTRKLVFIGLIITGLGWFCFSQIRGLWMFYLSYLVIALGQSIGGWLPLTTMLNNWFIRRRATAMGWSYSSSRMGSLFLVPAIAWAIDPDFNRLGWGFTSGLIGSIIILIALPLSRLLRDRPEEYGLLPDGDTPKHVPDNPNEKTDENSLNIDFTVKEAIMTKAFWLISFGHGLTSMILIGLMAHLAPMMTDHGYSLQTAAYVVTAYTAVSMIFQIIGGFMGDRVPKNLAITFFALVQSSAVFILIYGPATLPIAFTFATLFGIGFGGRNPLTTSIRGEYFGRKSFGKIMGVSQVPMNILLLAAPVLLGLMRDSIGDYVLAFTILAGLSAFGGTLFLFAKRPVSHITRT